MGIPGGWRQAGDRPEAAPDLPGTETPSLIELMRMSREERDRFTCGSAMRRAGYAGFKRDVAVALGNWRAPDAVPALVRALEDPGPLARGHAAWALGRIGTEEARRARARRLEVGPDDSTREELEIALGR